MAAIFVSPAHTGTCAASSISRESRPESGSSKNHGVCASPHTLKSSIGGLVAPSQLTVKQSAAVTQKKTWKSHQISRRTLAAATATTAKSTLTWEQLHGLDNWVSAGLSKSPANAKDKDLQLHKDFVKEIIKYGELTQATYDGFHPQNKGLNKYTRSELLVKSLPKNSDTHKENYKVEEYMHSASGFEGLFAEKLATFQELIKREKREIPNFAGYIAYKEVGPPDASGKPEIEIVVAFRGTILNSEWISNLSQNQQPWIGYDAALVHNGFQQIYRDDASPNVEDFKDPSKSKPPAKDSPQFDVRDTILRLGEKNRVRNIVTVGHSLGAALATIAALDIAQYLADALDDKNYDTDPNYKGTFKSRFRAAFPGKARPPVSCFAYASPRVGNKEFANLFTKYGVKLVRLTDVPDIVPMVPGDREKEDIEALMKVVGGDFYGRINQVMDLKFPNIGQLAGWKPPAPKWCEVGAEIRFDYTQSSILKVDLSDVKVQLGRFHNLEVYLYLIATQLGKQPEPDLTKPITKPGPNERDFRLCNKSDDTLNDDIVEKLLEAENFGEQYPTWRKCWRMEVDMFKLPTLAATNGDITKRKRAEFFKSVSFKATDPMPLDA